MKQALSTFAIVSASFWLGLAFVAGLCAIAWAALGLFLCIVIRTVKFLL